METDNIYLNPQLKLDVLADRLSLSEKVVSSLLNQHLKKNFNDFVNEYRVEEAKKRLAEPAASRFTIAEIEHLIELQKDPVMAKMQAEMPGIATESTALGRAAVSREMPRMAERIQQVVKDYYAAHGDSPGT